MGDLLSKAEKSTISKDELDEVVKRINNLSDKPNLEVLISILGETRRREYQKIIEKFLIYPENPMVSRTAMIILCQDWGLADQYIPFIKEMMRGTDWDGGQVRYIALMEGSKLFYQKNDKELLKILLDVFENEQEEKRCAYEAIGLAIGMDLRDLRSKSFDQRVIEQAYQKLNQ